MAPVPWPLVPWSRSLVPWSLVPWSHGPGPMVPGPMVPGPMVPGPIGPIGIPFLECRISPFLNAGFLFLHAEFSFFNAGFPFLNAGFPFLNAGFPFLKTKSPFLRTGFAPRYFKILAGTLQNGFCHNLHYMALFGIPRPGFCMVFQPGSFVCSCPGTDFEPGIEFWIPRSTCWPGDVFGVKHGSRKK